MTWSSTTPRWVGFPSPSTLHSHPFWRLRQKLRGSVLGVVTLTVTELYDGRGVALYGCRCCSWTAFAVEPIGAPGVP